MFRTAHVRLLVADFPACFRFYQDTLGLPPRFNLDDVYAEFDVSGQTLALYHRSMMAEVVGTAARSASADAQDAAMLVLAADDLEEAAEVLRSRGVIFVAPPQDRPEWGIRTAHFRDPDGNLIEINSAIGN